MASVDVVIPCYQHGRFLRDCVGSVLGQSVAELRILIIDNASSDGSADIALRLAAEDRRIEVIARTRNLGPHASFNAGVDWATSDFVLILCADDLLMPGSLEEMVSVMEQNPDVSFVYGNDRHWRAGEARPRGDDVAPFAWRVREGIDFIAERCRNPERYIAAGMVLVRTSAHKAAGHYRPELPHTDDFEMLLRLACLGRVADTQAVLGIKRMHGENRTHDFLRERTRDLVERLRALESFFSHEGRTLADPHRLLDMGRRSIAERAYWCGLKDLAHGRRSALALLGLAFRLAPSMTIIPPLNYLGRMDRPLLDTLRSRS